MQDEKAYLSDTEIKSELCSMLEATDAYLKKNNIRYSIMSGTMLGTIRHGGFIPWDDDVDIALLRADYDKLVELLKYDPYITKELFGSGFEIDKGDWPFIKVYNKNVIVQENGVYKTENLWIDIFPFDGVPKHFTKEYFKLVNLLRRIFHRKREVEEFYSKKDDEKGLKKKLSKLIVCKINRNRLFELYIRVCSKYDAEKTDKVQDITWGKKPIARDLFDNIIDYKFENIIVKGFKEYDIYLKSVYGDYMQLPPEDERINHGIKAWRIENEN